VNELSDIDDVDTTIDELNASGLMVIGTPDQLIEQIDALKKRTAASSASSAFHSGWPTVSTPSSPMSL
jgi:hypothetical protein